MGSTHFPHVGNMKGAHFLFPPVLRELAMSEPESPEKQRSESGLQHHAEIRGRMPFDTSDLQRLPQTNDEDPPYRNWWVCDDRNAD